MFAKRNGNNSDRYTEIFTEIKPRYVYSRYVVNDWCKMLLLLIIA